MDLVFSVISTQAVLCEVSINMFILFLVKLGSTLNHFTL